MVNMEQFKDLFLTVISEGLAENIPALEQFCSIVITTDIDFAQLIGLLGLHEDTENKLIRQEEQLKLKNEYTKTHTIEEYERLLQIVLTFVIPVMFKINYDEDMYTFDYWNSKKVAWTDSTQLY